MNFSSAVYAQRVIKEKRLLVFKNTFLDSLECSFKTDLTILLINQSVPNISCEQLVFCADLLFVYCSYFFYHL